MSHRDRQHVFEVNIIHGASHSELLVYPVHTYAALKIPPEAVPASVCTPADREALYDNLTESTRRTLTSGWGVRAQISMALAKTLFQME